jgi:hypothetical protein
LLALTDQCSSQAGYPGSQARAVLFELVERVALELRHPAVDGGDEETRTPDPLLAKEMLCQLSYVP